MHPFKIWRQIGTTKNKEAIYKNLDTGELAVEKDHMYLVEPTKEELKVIKCKMDG